MAESGKKKGRERSNRIIGRRFRYTEDYMAVPTISSTGRRVNELVYTGKWILPVNEEGEYKSLTLKMRILTAVALLAVIAAGVLVPLPLANKWFIPVLLAALFPLVYQIMGAVTLKSRPDYLERAQYDKTVVRTGHCAMAGFVIVCISAVLFIVYWMVVAFGSMEEAGAFGVRDAAVAAAIVIAALAELGVFLTFRKIKVETLENSAHRP